MGTEITEETRNKVMTQPLPAIIDDLVMAIAQARAAALDAREATEEARKAGEKAASEAARVAEKLIAGLQGRVEEGFQTITNRLLEAETTANAAKDLAQRLNTAMAGLVTGLGELFSAANDLMAELVKSYNKAIA